MLEEMSSQLALAAFACFVVSIFINGFHAIANIIFVIIFATTIIIAIMIIIIIIIGGQRFWQLLGYHLPYSNRNDTFVKGIFHVRKLSTWYAANAVRMQFKRTDWLLISITVVGCKILFYQLPTINFVTVFFFLPWLPSFCSVSVCTFLNRAYWR